MKIPLIWLKDYVNVSDESVADSFTALGLMQEKPVENGVLELEHRFDRSDWLSILGCARDLSAFEGISLKYPKSHDKGGKKPEKSERIAINIDCPNKVHRFNTRVFKGIRVGESPKWLRERLEAYGMPTINNIVDITNFVMIELGQPLHAQDLAKFETPEITIRHARRGEKVVTLDGTKVELDEDTFILTNNDRPIGIGGIVGGRETSVTKSTTDIILDAGNYDQTSIRQTSRRLKIQNETVLRTDKFLHPKLTQGGIERATHLILELAGGEYFENEDYYPQPRPLKQMTLHLKRIAQLSGMDFKLKKVKKIMEALEYRILNEKEGRLELEVPFFRTDVEVEDDLVADVLRINDYTNIPSKLIESPPPQEITPKIYDYEDRIRDVLVNLGLHEHITDPLVAGDRRKLNQVILENSQSSEKNALRIDMYTTLNPVISYYKKHGIKEVGVFEIGKTYRIEGSKKKPGSYREAREVEVIYWKANLSVPETSRKVKEILAGLLENLGIKGVDYKKGQGKEGKGERGRGHAGLYFDKVKIGEVRYNSFTLLAEELLKIPAKDLRVVSELKHRRHRDLSLVVEANQPTGPIYSAVTSSSVVSGATISQEYLDNKLGVNKKSILLGLDFKEDADLKEAEKTIIEELKRKFGAKVRK